MHEKISTQQLEEALRGDYQTFLAGVVDAVNQAPAGRIIAASEEPVRQAAARLRQRSYEQALQFRQQQSEPAFSPWAHGGGAEVGE